MSTRMYPQDTQKGKDSLNNHDAEKIDTHQQKSKAGILLALKVKTSLCQRIQSRVKWQPLKNGGDENFHLPET